MGPLLDLFSAGRPPDPHAACAVTDVGVVTYGELDAQAARAAAVLRDRGVRPGDRVAVQVEKSTLALALYLGCLQAGAVFLPLNPTYAPDEVAWVLQDAEPSLSVVDPSLRALHAAVPTVTLDAAGGGELADALDAAGPAPTAGSDASTVAALLYTSGTTGRPKGVPLTHGNLAANAAVLRDAWGFTADDVLVHVLPLFHAHGLFVAVHCVLAAGCSMRFAPRFDAARTVAAFAGATVFMGVPTHYARLLAEPSLDRAACSGMRLFVSGSAPLPEAVHGEFQTRTGHEILERYGMTETVMLTSNPLHGPRRPGTVGRPLPGVGVRIGRDGGDGGDGVGPVEVRGPSVFGGYWRRPDLQATEFTADGWFRTGDLGRFDPDGYLHLVGRSKDLVITGGLNVYPKEVEQVLDAQPGVAESAVIGVPDADLGEAVVALVVAAPGGAPDVEVLRAAAREHLAPYKVPKRVHVVEGLPRNAMGKVQKAELRSRFRSA